MKQELKLGQLVTWNDRPDEMGVIIAEADVPQGQVVVLWQRNGTAHSVFAAFLAPAPSPKTSRNKPSTLADDQVNHQ